MAPKPVVGVVRRYLAKLMEAGIPVVSGILYGSFARGAARRESDIDLLVLSPAFDGTKDEKQVDTLWHMAWRVDSRIEPIAVGVKEFETDTGSPLIGIARQEGIVVPAPPAAAATTARRTLAPALVKERRGAYGKRGRAKRC